MISPKRRVGRGAEKCEKISNGEEAPDVNVYMGVKLLIPSQSFTARASLWCRNKIVSKIEF